MSVGRVINGKLAVRDGRLACDCCGDQVDPGPSGGCVPCVVTAPNTIVRTTHFGGCINTNTPDNIPPLVPGDSVAHEPVNYPDSGWNPPGVVLSGSWTYSRIETLISNGDVVVNRIREGTVNYTLPQVVRQSKCNVWAGGGGSDGIQWEQTNLLNGSSFSGTGQASATHDFGGVSESSGPTCGIVTTTANAYNFRVAIEFDSTPASAVNRLQLYASTGDLFSEDALPNPCYGTGGSAFFASPNGSNGTLRGGFNLLGRTCQSKSLTWGGSYDDTSSNAFRNILQTWEWSISATISGMTDCPEELIV